MTAYCIKNFKERGIKMKLYDFANRYTGMIEEEIIKRSTPLIFAKDVNETAKDAEKRFKEDIKCEAKDPGYLYQMGYYNDKKEDDEPLDDYMQYVVSYLDRKNQNNIQKYFNTLNEAVNYVYSLNENEVLPNSLLN